CISGATILGDGRVALILDVAGVANYVNLRPVVEHPNKQSKAAADERRHNAEVQSVLMFNNRRDENFAVPMGLISRIEAVAAHEIESVGRCEVLHSRGSVMPLIQLETCVAAAPAERSGALFAIVYPVAGLDVGLLVSRIED